MSAAAAPAAPATDAERRDAIAAAMARYAAAGLRPLADTPANAEVMPVGLLDRLPAPPASANAPAATATGADRRAAAEEVAKGELVPTGWLSRASVEAVADAAEAKKKRDRKAAQQLEEERECRRERVKEETSACRRARREDEELGRRLNDPNDPIAIAAERDRLESIKASVRRDKERALQRELEAAGIVRPSFGDMLGPHSTRLMAEYEARKSAYLVSKGRWPHGVTADGVPLPPPPPAPPAAAAAAPAPAPVVDLTQSDEEAIVVK